MLNMLYFPSDHVTPVIIFVLENMKHAIIRSLNMRPVSLYVLNRMKHAIMFVLKARAP